MGEISVHAELTVCMGRSTAKWRTPGASPPTLSVRFDLTVTPGLAPAAARRLLLLLVISCWFTEHGCMPGVMMGTNVPLGMCPLLLPNRTEWGQARADSKCPYAPCLPSHTGRQQWWRTYSRSIALLYRDRYWIGTVNSVHSDAQTFNYSKCSLGMLFLCLSTQINLPCV